MCANFLDLTGIKRAGNWASLGSSRILVFHARTHLRNTAMEPIRAAVIIAFTLFLLAWVPAPAQSSEPEHQQDATVIIDDQEWARTTNGQDMRWPDAVEYCEKLTLGGRDDWRLPTLPELESLHDSQADYGIREPFDIDTCCLWSNESLVDRPAEDGDEIGGTPDRYQWGFMFDGGHHYYAVHIFEDGQALCTRNMK